MSNDEENAKRIKDAAESTRFRSAPVPDLDGDARTFSQGRGGSDAYLASAKSIRMHSRTSRGGLAMRLAIPVIVAMLLGMIVYSLIIRSRVSNVMLNKLKADAGNAAFTSGLLGRLLIIHRDKFLADNPDYLARGEWVAGEHWLVTHGFVGGEDWVEATGFQLEEYAPISTLDSAGEKTILAGLSRYVNSPRSSTEIVAVFLLNPDGTVFASGQKASFRFDPLALKAFTPVAPPVHAGDTVVYVDYVPDIQPEPLVRGLARIMAADDSEELLGSAVVVLRTQRYSAEQRSFTALLAGLTLLYAALMALACWYSARRITVPLRCMAENMQAMAEGDYARRAGINETDELGLLAQAFNSMAERLRVARLNEKETSRLESDLAIARDIQNNLLPPQTPRVRGLDIFTSYRPAREIGGDYFDFLPVDEQHMGMVVADASGKSIPAALVMSTTRAILRFVAPGSASAAETLARVNAILSVDIPKGMFVTAYYVILDPLADTMLCASAGHTPLLIARADDSVEILNPGGIALGFDSGPIFQRSIREQKVKLERGDRVLLYTDGVVECVNPSNEEYSDRRLREFLRRNRQLTSHDFVGALMADLDRHRGAAEMRDDTTIVTFRVL